MLSGSLHGTSAFLAFLGTGPRAEDVTAALLDGPLRPLGAVSCGIYALRDQNLRLLHMRGVPPAMRERYAVIDCALDVPVSRALHASEPVVVPAVAMPEHEALAPDGRVWEEFTASVQDGPVVHAAMAANERPNGVFVYASARAFPWDEWSASTTQALAAALGLWLAAFPDVAPARLPRTHVLALTPRQREVLRLVELGQTNAQIARSLGYSISTVKQDVQRAMSVVGSHDRSAVAARARELGLLAGPSASIASPQPGGNDGHDRG